MCTLRRFLSAVTILASLLLLGQVPVAHAVTSIRPGAADIPIPTEEEQRTEVAERVCQTQLALRHKRHIVYQETVEPTPAYRLHGAAVLQHSFDRPSPSVFAGAPRPLRC